MGAPASASPHPRSTAVEPLRVTRIVPTERGLGLDAGELWRSRDLLRLLVLRDIKVRYRQTFLGVAWALLVPLTQMVIFGVLFGRIAKLPSDGLDPFVFYLSGLVPWQYFANAVSLASTSLVQYSHLLTKIYFPRLFIPLGVCIAGLVDLGIALGLLGVAMLMLQVALPATALFVPLLIGIAFVNALGAGLFLSALHVRYRDVKFVVPFLIQVWMYATIVLPFSQLPESWGGWRYLYGANPLAGVVEGIRWCLLHEAMAPMAPPWRLVVAGLPSTALLLFFGLRRFRQAEREFSDVV